MSRFFNPKTKCDNFQDLAKQSLQNTPQTITKSPFERIPDVHRTSVVKAMTTSHQTTQMLCR